MNKGSESSFEMEDGENGLPVINGENESSTMPVDIGMRTLRTLRSDDEYSEVKNSSLYVRQFGGILNPFRNCQHHMPMTSSTFQLVYTQPVLSIFRLF